MISYHVANGRSSAREGDSWVTTDVETGVTTQGETREEALEMLDEAVALYKGEIGESIDTPEEREVLRDLGIDAVQ